MLSIKVYSERVGVVARSQLERSLAKIPSAVIFYCVVFGLMFYPKPQILA